MRPKPREIFLSWRKKLGFFPVDLASTDRAVFAEEAYPKIVCIEFLADDDESVSPYRLAAHITWYEPITCLLFRNFQDREFRIAHAYTHFHPQSLHQETIRPGGVILKSALSLRLQVEIVSASDILFSGLFTRLVFPTALWNTGLDWVNLEKVSFCKQPVKRLTPLPERKKSI